MEPFEAYDAGKVGEYFHSGDSNNAKKAFRILGRHVASLESAEQKREWLDQWLDRVTQHIVLGTGEGSEDGTDIDRQLASLILCHLVTESEVSDVCLY